MQYNPTKTVSVVFSLWKIVDKPDLQLCVSTLKWVDHVKLPGNHLESNLREVMEIRIDMIRVNIVLVSLGKSKDRIISKVFNSQCTHFYGAQAWRFEDKAVKEFHTMLNLYVRRVLRLPYETHRRFLPHLIGTQSASDQIFSRFLKMQSVSFIIRMCWDSARSISGGNLGVIAKRLSTDGHDVQTNGRSRVNHRYVDECSVSDHTA